MSCPNRSEDFNPRGPNLIPSQSEHLGYRNSGSLQMTLDCIIPP